MLRTVKVLADIVWFVLSKYGLMKKYEKMMETDPTQAGIEAQKHVSGIMNKILKSAGTELTIKGLENVPEDKPCLFIGNHRSYFDVVIGYGTVPKQTGFIGKKELQKLPLIPRWMLCMKCLFLDRKDLKQGMKTILTAISHVKNGTSIWIFPEGTRNESENPAELMPFKEGSFKIAEKTGCPVIPVAILGTDDILEKHFPSIKKQKATIVYGEPIYIKELPDDVKKFPGAYTQNIISEMIKQELELNK